MIPLYNVVPSYTFMSLVNSIADLQRKGYFVDVFHVNHTLIHEARQSLTKLLADRISNGYHTDYVLWIDSDMCEFDAEKIIRLIEHLDSPGYYDILSALYFKHAYPPGVPAPVALKKRPEGQDGYESISGFVPGERVEIDAAGFGFLLMKPETLVDLYNTHTDIFTIEEFNGKYGEDVCFSIIAKKSGYKIGVDTSVPVGHGFYVVNDQTYYAMRDYYEKRTK